VKKGIVALLIVLALFVLISPGIVGMLAEKSVDEQIERATTDNQDLIITAERFERGWFSSEGRHRIELQDSVNANTIRDFLGLGRHEALPALIVDTKLSHGPITLSSMSDSNGSLVPGLGKAVSTLSMEMPDGTIVELPGTVYSFLNLAGDLESTFKAEAAQQDAATWGDIIISFASTASTGAYAYDGHVEALQFVQNNDRFELSNFSFSGDLEMSDFGFAVGDMQLALDTLYVVEAGSLPVSIGPILFDTHTSADNGRLDSRSELSLAIDGVPGIGQFGIDTRLELEGVDGVALRRLVESLQSSQSGASMSAVEEQLLDVIAAGADLRIERLDIALPQGTIKSEMNIQFLERDRATFGWTSMLLALEADAKFEIPELIADMAMMMVPQAGTLEGFLVKNGDVYELEAAYKKGLLTVNGVPMPIPLR
jgi:uncharacterized protein YdgA (DUF945 family)